MLPFLNKSRNNNAGVIVKERQPDEKHDEIQPDTLEDCAMRLLEAFKSGDKKAMVEALRDVHDELHLEMDEKSESYDSQNEKAADKE